MIASVQLLKTFCILSLIIKLECHPQFERMNTVLIYVSTYF